MEYWSAITSIIVVGAFCLFVYSGFKKQPMKETLRQIWEFIGGSEKQDG